MVLPKSRLICTRRHDVPYGDKILEGLACISDDGYILTVLHHHHHHKHEGLDQFDPFRHQSYNCSRQRFLGLPIVPLPCGL